MYTRYFQIPLFFQTVFIPSSLNFEQDLHRLIVLNKIDSRYMHYQIPTPLLSNFLQQVQHPIQNSIEYNLTAMSRTTPWRNKPTTLITQMLPVAAEIKLYLVNEIGPTSFMFKDDNENKFKVSIGLKVSCSCGIVVNDHCIHTLYVMLKKYRVPETHPIIWQASYLDSELDGLTQFKYRQKIKKQEQVSSVFRHRNPYMENNEEEIQDDDFPPLKEDQTCPVCYEGMENQCYSTCGVCHNSIHSKCLRVWAQFKLSKGPIVTCPLCRSIFSDPLGMVTRDLQKWEKKFTVHKGTTCKCCGVKNIQGFVRKCLHCSNTVLCSSCYQANRHPEHQHFFVKQLNTDAWKVAPIRPKKNKKISSFDPSKGIISTHQIPKEIDSPEFFVSLFPTIRQHQATQKPDQLGIFGNEMHSKQICNKCSGPGDQKMKKLKCGHSLHAKCLGQMFQRKQFRCEIDQQPLCQGYLEAMGIKLQPKQKKKQIDNPTLLNNKKKQGVQPKKNKIGLTDNVFGAGLKAERLNERHNSNSKMALKNKDRNFRIMKKQTLERKREIQLMGVGVGFGVTGVSHQPPLPGSNNRNRTAPKFR